VLSMAYRDHNLLEMAGGARDVISQSHYMTRSDHSVNT
jgi:hypothetical protein